MLRIGLVVLSGLCALAGSASAAPKLYYLAASSREVALEGEFQRRLVLEQRFLNQYRLDTIRFNLGRAAAPFCKSETQPDFGLRVATGSNFAGNEQKLVEDGFGFDDRLRVQHVIPGSSAQQAGLHSGDEIAAINGRAIGAGSDGARSFASATSSASHLVLSIRRGSVAGISPQSFDAKLEAAEICKFDVELTDAESIGALTVGNHITVSKGMMWFANDSQLAFVLAHEFAHVLGDHGRLVQAGTAQMEVEPAADYVGLYIMARGGYDVSEGPAFFRRVAANFPQMISLSSSHPATPYRYVALTKAVEEIKAKIASRVALMPGPAQEASRTMQTAFSLPQAP